MLSLCLQEKNFLGNVVKGFLVKFLYNDLAGINILQLYKEDYKYLCKVKRHKLGDMISLRNLKDDFIYLYKIIEISKKDLLLELNNKQKLVIKSSKKFHVGWCIVDVKMIEKTLPMLNEIGVSKISFIYCQRSQKNFKINLNRLKKIIINSSQQCGRSVMMEFEIIDSLSEYFERYPKSDILDFGGVTLCKNKIENILIGCEGGFSEDERKTFENRSIYRLDTPMILRSESAVVAISSLCLI